MRSHGTNHRTTWLLAAGMLLLGEGCYTAALDPELTGLFACDEDGDEASSLCPAGQACVNHRCEDADALPSLQVIAPENEQPLPADVSELFMGMPPGPAIDVIMSVQGSLELTTPGADHEIGEGHVVVYVDENEQQIIDSGDIAGTMTVPLLVQPVAGPHRIVVQAVRNDGIPYDNAEATATRLFWLENQNQDLASRRPFVAFKSPWPGMTFGLESQDIEIELATLHFDLFDPGDTNVERRGHAHIHHNDGFPMCLENPACNDIGHLGVVGASRTITITLPPSGAQSDELTAILRNFDHSAYGIPFGCDPTLGGPLDLCSPIFDTIEILRVED